MKYAYFGVPHTGGTYTVYRHLREGLKQHGIEVRWAGLGRRAFEVASDAKWAFERANGEVVAPDCTSEKELAELFTRYLIDEKFDGVFVNVLADRVQTNIARYIPEHIRRIMIVHSITPATYAAARAVRDYVHVTVGVSPRIRNDLVASKGFLPERCLTIPNGVDLEPYAALKPTTKEKTLRMISLGRVEDTAKGVFWLPNILAKLTAIDWCLTVAGDGPDLAKLKEQCRPFGDRVRFDGQVTAQSVPELLAHHDVMLFPSRFEGLSLALVEAQAAGCVPVASRIRGVSDYVVEHGKNGLLFPIGDCRQAAEHIMSLARDRDRLTQMSSHARQAASGLFSLERMANAYAEAIALATELNLPQPPLSLDSWSMPKGMLPGLRSALPQPIKNVLTLLRERTTSFLQRRN